MKESLKRVIKKYSNLKSLRIHPKNILSFVRDDIKYFIMQPAYRYLEKIKQYQKYTFERLKSRFKEYYNKINRHNINKFITPTWNEYNCKIEPSVLPYPKFSFLNEPVIKSTMFIPSHVKWVKDELKYIKIQFSKEIFRLNYRKNLS